MYIYIDPVTSPWSLFGTHYFMSYNGLANRGFQIMKIPAMEKLVMTSYDLQSL